MTMAGLTKCFGCGESACAGCGYSKKEIVAELIEARDLIDGYTDVETVNGTNVGNKAMKALILIQSAIDMLGG